MVNAENSINRLIGEWRANMTFNMEDGSIAKGRGTAIGRSIALGRGVQFVLKGNMEGIGSYEENNLVAYDPEEDTICLFTVTSLGIVQSRIGRYDSGDTLMMRWNGRIDGRSTEREITVSLTSDDSFTIRQVDHIDGNVSMVGEYHYQRSGKKVLEEPVPTFA
ncbi:MAG: DUF1579 domain-containing protein [Euryarchaeota archaeon]|nr:DUF1579 domain-containing protein [Euryarchaeota archaeon]